MIWKQVNTTRNTTARDGVLPLITFLYSALASLQAPVVYVVFVNSVTVLFCSPDTFLMR